MIAAATDLSTTVLPHLLAEIDDHLGAIATRADQLDYLDRVIDVWRRRRDLYLTTHGSSELLLQPHYRMTRAALASMLLAIGARRALLIEHDGDDARDTHATTAAAPIELATHRRAAPMTAWEAWC